MEALLDRDGVIASFYRECRVHVCKRLAYRDWGADRAWSGERRWIIGNDVCGKQRIVLSWPDAD